MKNSLKLKTVAWIMVLLGIFYVYVAFLIKQREIYIGSRYYNIFLFENLIMGMGNFVLGIGLLKPQKWAVLGAMIFGGFAFFFCLSKLTFFGGFKFILLLVFYGLVVYFAFQESKNFEPNK